MVLSFVPPSPREDPPSSPGLRFFLPDFDPLTGWILDPEFEEHPVDDHSVGSLLAADDQDGILLASGAAIGDAGESVDRPSVSSSPSRSGGEERVEDSRDNGSGEDVNFNGGILLGSGAAIGDAGEGFIEEEEEANAGGDESEGRPAGRSSLPGSGDDGRRDFINCNGGVLLASDAAIGDAGEGFMEEEEDAVAGGDESEDLLSVRSSPSRSGEMEKEEDSGDNDSGEDVNCNGGILLASIGDTGEGFMEEEEEEECSGEDVNCNGGILLASISDTGEGFMEEEEEEEEECSGEDVNYNGGILLASIGNTGEGFMEELEEEEEEEEECSGEDVNCNGGILLASIGDTGEGFMEEEEEEEEEEAANAEGDESKDRPANGSYLSGSREKEREEVRREDGCGDFVHCNGGILLTSIGDAGEGFIQEEEEEEEEAGGDEPEDGLDGRSSTSSDEYWFMKEETEVGGSSPSISGEEEKEEDSHNHGGRDVNSNGGHGNCGEMDAEDETDEEEDANSNGGHRHYGEMDVEDEIEDGEIIDSGREDNCASGDDDEDAVVEPIRSRNEIEDLPPVPQVEVCLERHHNALPVGVISSIMGTRIIVEGLHQHNPLNEGSVLWITETRLPLGLVDEIFGSVKLPYYVIRYNNENEVPVGVSIGTAVSFVVEFVNYILSGKDLYKKGYNASGERDEVLDGVEFSDDEVAAEYRRFLRQTKRASCNIGHGDQKSALDKKAGSNFVQRLFGFSSMQEQEISGPWNAHSFMQTPSSSQGRSVRQTTDAQAPPLGQGVSGSCNAKSCSQPPQATNRDLSNSPTSMASAGHSVVRHVQFGCSNKQKRGSSSSFSSNNCRPNRRAVNPSNRPQINRVWKSSIGQVPLRGANMEEQGPSGSCNVQSNGQPMATNDQVMMHPPMQFNPGRPPSSFRGKKRYRGGRGGRHFYQRGGWLQNG